MLTLLLLRHAKAEPAMHGVADIDRSLAPRGRTDAPRMGAFIASAGLVPDLVLCSTARRTRETLALVASQFGAIIATKEEPAIYEASTPRLLSVIRRTPSSVHRLLLVGHNPGFEDLVSELALDGEKEAMGRLEKKYPTSGLAVLTFPFDAWAKVTGRTGHVTLFTAPRYLEAD